MNIIEVTVSYEETCSLPGYNNVRPGVRLTAQVSGGESASAREILMAKAVDQVRDEIDRALIANYKAPKYSQSTRYRILISSIRHCILVVPLYVCDLPDDFYTASSSTCDVTNLLYDQAIKIAEILREAYSTRSHEYGGIVSTYGDLSDIDELAPLPPEEPDQAEKHYDPEEAEYNPDEPLF